jgi:hypothetical protein
MLKLPVAGPFWLLETMWFSCLVADWSGEIRLDEPMPLRH